jgi:excinuclease ABC subunit C
VRRLSKVKKLLLTPKTPDEVVAEMRTHVRATAKDRPGVYRWLSDDGEVVYVGKSKRLRTRLLSYFRCGSDEKGSRIVREATRVEWEYTPSEFAALLEELRLIKRFRPRLNVAMKRDARHFAFIKLTRGPAPKLLVVRGAGGDDAQIYYGPFHGAQRTRPPRLSARPADALRRSAGALSDLPPHAGLHPARDQEVPRSVRRRLHHRGVRRARSARALLPRRRG